MPEPPEPAETPPAADARPGGIGSGLLREFPPVSDLSEMPTKLEVPAVSLPPSPPKPPAVHGSHLVSPMQPGPSGYRVSSCPVCLTQAVVPQLAGGWAPLRCASCGTEFVASDGSPPPPTVTIKPLTSARVSGPESRLLALMLLGDGGQRHAHCPACRSLEIVPAVGVRVDMRCASCGTEFTAVPTLPPRHPTAPPPPPPPAAARHAPAASPGSAGVVVTDAVLTDMEGNKFVICPLCRKFKKQLPRVTPTFSVSVTCEGCRRPFIVNVPREMLKKPAAKLPYKRPETRKRTRWWLVAITILPWALLGYIAWRVATEGWGWISFSKSWFGN